MDIGITVHRTYDPLLICAVMHDDDLFERASEDGQTKDEFWPVDSNCYLLVMDENDIIGLVVLEPQNSVSILIHPYFLKPFRKKAKAAFKPIYEWILENTDYQKINAEIVSTYKNTYQFALNVGFQDEGITRQGWKKNNKLHDLHRVGITRPEIEAYINAIH